MSEGHRRRTGRRPPTTIGPESPLAPPPVPTPSSSVRRRKGLRHSDWSCSRGGGRVGRGVGYSAASYARPRHGRLRRAVSGLSYANRPG